MLPSYFNLINPDVFSPFPKNPVIARVFKEIGLADELGSGIRNLVKYGKFYSKTVPQLVEEDTFKCIIALVDQNEPVKGSPKGSPKTGGLILSILNNEPEITTEQISVELGISKRAVLKQLDKLKSQGLLKRHGSSRAGYWEIMK